jgi:hypothetical protein
LPRRLGDDPLTRKRSPSAKARDSPSAQPASVAQQTSHNDVFFRRRTENPLPKLEGTPDHQGLSLGEAVNTDEKPEITEVADIVRTAQVAMKTQGAEQLTEPMPIDEPHPATEEPVVTIEQTPSIVAEPAVAVESSPPITEEQVAPASSQPQPEPRKSDGFFKRLFGRLGK